MNNSDDHSLHQEARPYKNPSRYISEDYNSPNGPRLSFDGRPTQVLASSARGHRHGISPPNSDNRFSPISPVQGLEYNIISSRNRANNTARLQQNNNNNNNRSHHTNNMSSSQAIPLNRVNNNHMTNSRITNINDNHSNLHRLNHINNNDPIEVISTQMSTENDEKFVRETIYQVLKLHTIAFFFFILLLLYFKFQVSFYYAVAFLWLSDVYGIVIAFNFMSDNQELIDTIAYVVDLMEYILLIVFKILLVLTIEIQGFAMTYSLIPFIPIFLTKIILLVWKRKIDVSFILLAFFGLQMLNISLKYDKFINWEWKEVFWIFWIAFSLLIGATFTLLLLLLSKCSKYCFGNGPNFELKGAFWLFCVLSGITTLSSAFVMYLIQYLEVHNMDTINGLVRIMYVIITYCLIQIIITLTCLKDIEQKTKFKVEQIINTLYIYAHQYYILENIQQNYSLSESSNVEFCLFVCERLNIKIIAERNKTAEVQEEKIEIPKFLLQISSTYFGKANESDVKNLNGNDNESQTKKKKKLPRLDRLRTNSFDYSKLTRATENTVETKRENIQNNMLMTIPSARSKEDLESYRKNIHTENTNAPNTVRKLPQELIKLRPTPRSNLCESMHEAIPLEKVENFENEAQNQSDLKNLDNDYNSPKKPEDILIEIEDNNDNNNKKKIQNKKILLNIEEIIKNKLTHRKIKSEILESRLKDEPLFGEEIQYLANNDNNGKLDLTKQQNPNERSVIACLICFDKQPDAVFMDCGHGGVCYECSLEVWSTTNECYLCRKPIKQVLQFDTKKTGKSNLVKVISSTQMFNFNQHAKSESIEYIEDNTY